MLEVPVNSTGIKTLNEELKKADAGMKAVTKSTADLRKEIVGVEDEIDRLSKTYGENSKQADEARKQLASLNLEYDSIVKSNESAVKSINSLEDSLSKLNQELNSAEIGSAAYRELEKEVIKVSSELKNLELARESLDNEQFASEAKSVAGGLGEMAGGLALVGASNQGIEKIVQTMAQVDGITRAVTGAIEAYSSGVKIANALIAKGNVLQNISTVLSKKDAVGKVAQTAATGAQATATGVATTATYALNAAMLLNPVFLLVAGLAALVGALAYFSSSTETAEDRNKRLNAVIEKQTELLERNNEKAIRGAQNKLNLLRAQGATAEEIYNAEAKLLEEQEKAREKERDVTYNILQARKVEYKLALAAGNEELAKSIQDEIKQVRGKYKDLKALDGQYLEDKKVLDASFNSQKEKDDKATSDKAIADNKAANDKARAAREKRLAEEKKYNEDRLNAARKIIDLELSLMTEGVDKEVAIQEENNKRQLEDLNTQYGDLTKLNKEQLDEYNKTRELLISTGNAKVLEIQKKASDERIALEKELSDKIKEAINAEESINISVIQAQYDTQLASLKDKLDKELITIEEYNRLKLEAETEFQTESEVIKKNYAQRERDAQLALLKKSDNYEDKISVLEQERTIALENKNLTESEIALIEDEYRVRRAELDKAETERKIADAAAIAGGISQGLDMISGISDTQFETQQAQRDERNAAELAGLEEGSEAYEAAKARQIAEDDKAAKKKFEIDKKLQIAQAVVQGVQAVLAAYSSGSAIPIVGAVTGPAFAALAAVATIANINKIKKSKYTSSSETPSTGGSGLSIDSVVKSAEPSLGLFGKGNDMNNVGPGAEQNANNNGNITVNATVSVSEINDAQNKVSVQEMRSSM